MSGPGQAPTRAAVVELKDERVVVNEAYNFLDEKRLLLAAEIIRQIDNYEKVIKAIKKLNIEARKALENAVQRHGLEPFGRVQENAGPVRRKGDQAGGAEGTARYRHARGP